MSERAPGGRSIAFRVGRLTLDPDTFPLFADPARSAREATDCAAAVSWHLARSARLSVHFERTWFQGGAGVDDRAPENALLSRMQVAF